MPTSDKQLEANRGNTLKSTGPKTPKGKRAVRQNALKHGILARETIISFGDYREDEAEFSTLLAGLQEGHDPAGPLEELLVQQIAVCYWRLRRVLRADSLEFGRSLEELARPPETFEYLGKIRVARAPSLPPPERLDTIVRYEKAIINQLDRALSHLDRLQRRRRGEADPPTLTVELSGTPS